MLEKSKWTFSIWYVKVQFAILGKRTLQMQVLLKETGYFQIKISRHAEYESAGTLIAQEG